MIRAFLVALDPTDAQVQQFSSHCGAQNYAYNWTLSQIKINLSQRQAEKSYGILEGQLTPVLSWNTYSLRKLWNTEKNIVAPWWSENSKEAYSSGIANLTTALTNWSNSKNSKRKGPKIRFPRFKSKRTSHRSCKFSFGAAVKLSTDRRHVQLPKIGLIRTHESTRKLARYIERGTARIRSATLSFQRGRWHVSLSVDLPDPTLEPRTTDRTVGIDLGIKSFAVLSTKEVVPNHRYLDRSLRSLRKAQRKCSRRRGPDKRTKTISSNRWRKANAGVTQLHTKISNQRRDGLHQLTTRITRDFDIIVIEDLATGNLIRNKRLSRHIGQLGWSEFRRQLTYKTQDAETQLIVADRFYPSSKTCFNCKTVKAKLTLANRTFNCDNCGYQVDRDLNAARNLRSLAQNISDPSLGELRPDYKHPAGNSRKTQLLSNGYCHGKTQTLSQRCFREEVTR